MPSNFNIKNFHEEMYLQKVREVWQLANAMMKAANMILHTTVLITNQEKEILAIESGWAGRKELSDATYFGPAKAIELVQTIGGDGDEFMFTPTPRHSLSNYKGGVRRRIEIENGSNLYFITACSELHEKADLFMSFFLNMAMMSVTSLNRTKISYNKEYLFQKDILESKRDFKSKITFLGEGHCLNQFMNFGSHHLVDYSLITSGNSVSKEVVWFVDGKDESNFFKEFEIFNSEKILSSDFYDESYSDKVKYSEENLSLTICEAKD